METDHIFDRRCRTSNAFCFLVHCHVSFQGVVLLTSVDAKGDAWLTESFCYLWWIPCRHGRKITWSHHQVAKYFKGLVMAWFGRTGVRGFREVALSVGVKWWNGRIYIWDHTCKKTKKDKTQLNTTNRKRTWTNNFPIFNLLLKFKHVEKHKHAWVEP